MTYEPFEKVRRGEVQGEIVCGDCLEVMAAMPCECVDLVMTSPPFNIGFDYGIYKDQLSWRDYYSWIANVVKQCYRIGVSGSIMAWNIPLEVRKPRSNPKLDKRIEPIFVESHKLAVEAGYLYRQSIVWIKGSEGNAIANSSHRGSDSDPFLRDCFEMIWLGSKERYYHDGGTGQRGILAVPLDESTKNVWWLPNQRVQGLPTYPEELAKRIIERFVHRQDAIIFDPFMCSGTTAVAADRLGRKFFGCDISPNYVEMALQRLEDDRKKRSQLELF